MISDLSFRSVAEKEQEENLSNSQVTYNINSKRKEVRNFSKAIARAATKVGNKTNITQSEMLSPDNILPNRSGTMKEIKENEEKSDEVAVETTSKAESVLHKPDKSPFSNPEVRKRGRVLKANKTSRFKAQTPSFDKELDELEASLDKKLNESQLENKYPPIQESNQYIIIESKQADSKHSLSPSMNHPHSTSGFQKTKTQVQKDSSETLKQKHSQHKVRAAGEMKLLDPKDSPLRRRRVQFDSVALKRESLVQFK